MYRNLWNFKVHQTEISQNLAYIQDFLEFLQAIKIKKTNCSCRVKMFQIVKWTLCNGINKIQIEILVRLGGIVVYCQVTNLYVSVTYNIINSRYSINVVNDFSKKRRFDFLNYASLFLILPRKTLSMVKDIKKFSFSSGQYIHM